MRASVCVCVRERERERERETLSQQTALTPKSYALGRKQRKNGFEGGIGSFLRVCSESTTQRTRGMDTLTVVAQIKKREKMCATRMEKETEKESE